MPFQNARTVRANRTNHTMHITTAMTVCTTEKPGMFNASPRARSVEIHPTFGNVRAQPAAERNHCQIASTRKGRSEESQRASVLTSENLAEVLVYFEPVGKDTKCEEEDGEAKKEKPSQHTRREPDLTGERGNEIMLWKSRI